MRRVLHTSRISNDESGGVRERSNFKLSRRINKVMLQLCSQHQGTWLCNLFKVRQKAVFFQIVASLSAPI